MKITVSRAFRFALLVVPCALLVVRAQPSAEPAHSAAKANILLIVVNGLRWDETGYAGHPVLRTPHLDRLAREGTQFESAFTSTPDPAGSFAGLLRGRHPAAGSGAGQTLPQALRDAGYRTCFVGRWPLEAEDPGRIGFDAWVNAAGGHVDPQLRTDRGTEMEKGAATEILTSRALDFITRKDAAPFCMVLAQPALEGTAEGSSRLTVAERHQRLYANDVPRRRPGLEVFVNPRAAPGATAATNRGASDEAIRNRWRVITGIDEAIGRIYETLRALGELDRTVIVVTGDHGFLYGEHGITGPGRTAHEESIRIPLLLRYPPIAKRGVAPGQLVLNVDVAPTLRQIAGLPVASAAAPGDGRSLVPLVSGKPPAWRFSFLIEGTAIPPGGTRPERYQAVRTPAWKYIRYLDGSGVEELYDHHADHYELINLADRATARNELRRWSAELGKVLRPAVPTSPK
jgi:N-acetylglucosamine-6-sulfatase